MRRTLGVVGAVLRKNAIEFIRYPVDLVLSFVMPLVWFLPIYFLIRSFAPDGVSLGLGSWIGATDFYAFFVTGLLVSQVVLSVFWGIGLSLKRLMDIGLLETIWVMPVSKVTYLLAESLFSVLRLVYDLGTLLLIFRFAFGMRVPGAIGAGTILIAPFLLMMYGFGLAYASLVLLVKNAELLSDTAGFLTTTLTGTQNPPQVFPRYILAISMAIPITYVLDLLRVKTMGIAPLLPLWLEGTIVGVAAAIFPLLGVLAFRAVERRSRIRGDVHTH